MKKIAFVIADVTAPGGAEKVLVDLVEEFHRRQHAVTVITFEDHQDVPKFSHPGNTLHIPLPSRKGGLFTQIILLLQRAWQFRKVFQRGQFDHIFSFLEAANVPCALASPRAVLSVHLDPGKMTRYEWLAFRWLYPRAHKVIAVSQQMQEMLSNRAKLSNVVCIHNPVNTQLAHEKAQEPIAIEGRFILAVGRLERQKRFDLLLEAFAQTAAHLYCTLVIAGEGKQRAVLEAQIAALGLGARVVLLGYERNPYKYMARAEFQVMSSDNEGYPLVLIEALSLGCPIVSTDCPTGPGEIIQHGSNGLLVATGSVEAIAHGIDQLFFDDALRLTMRTNAPASVRANDITAVADAWLAV